MLKLPAGLALVLACALPGAAAAQESAVRTIVEYIAGANVYLTVGETAGVFKDDTLAVRSTRPPARSGRFRVVGSTKDRAVVTFAGSAFPLTRGDTLEVTLPANRTASPVQPPAATPAAGLIATTQERAPGPARQQLRPSLPPRIDGTFAIDFDALNSDTRWGDASNQHVERRFLTPALRLHATAAQLPGGMRMITSLRYEYRYVQNEPVTSSALRVYQASLEKDFERAPLRMQIGRFYNPTDLYGGYFDGGLVRAGNSSFGVGAAAGYEPDRVNGGLSTTILKSSAFIDFAARGRVATYQTGLVVHDERNDSGPGTRYVSMTQRFRLGRALLLQRLRVDADSGWGRWNLSHFDANVLAPLVGDLLVRAHYQRRSFDWDLDADTAAPRQQRTGGGLLYTGSRFNFATDASLTRWSDGHETKSASGSMALYRLVSGIGLGASGSWWKDQGEDSYYISPWIERTFGSMRANFSFQQYHATAASAADYQSGMISVSFPMAGGFYTMLRATAQWGAGSSQRLFMTLSKSF